MNKLRIICVMALVIGCAMIFSACGGDEEEHPENNILMDNESIAKVLGSKFAREEVITITFLDSLDDMPDESWDVSADSNGNVMAWTTSRDDGKYDLYIGAKGGVTANEDCRYLFSGYKNVEQILFNNNFDITENTRFISMMFNECNNLKELDVSDFDTSNVTHMGGMFLACNSLTKLDVSNFDTSNVIETGMMFSGCNSLGELDVSNFDTSNVTDMGRMFCECSSLEKLDVSNFDTSKVMFMDYMFYGCSNLRELDVSNFDTSNVQDASYMFTGCGNLTDLNLNNFDASLVPNMWAQP